LSCSLAIYQLAFKKPLKPNPAGMKLQKKKFYKNKIYEKRRKSGSVEVAGSTGFLSVPIRFII